MPPGPALLLAQPVELQPGPPGELQGLDPEASSLDADVRALGDALDASHRPPRLDAAWRRVKHEFGELTAKKLLIDNPSAMIQGAEELGRKPPVSAAPDQAQAVPLPR